MNLVDWKLSLPPLRDLKVFSHLLMYPLTHPFLPLLLIPSLVHSGTDTQCITTYTLFLQNPHLIVCHRLINDRAHALGNVSVTF